MSAPKIPRKNKIGTNAFQLTMKRPNFSNICKRRSIVLSLNRSEHIYERSRLYPVRILEWKYFKNSNKLVVFCVQPSIFVIFIYLLYTFIKRIITKSLSSQVVVMFMNFVIYRLLKYFIVNKVLLPKKKSWENLEKLGILLQELNHWCFPDCTNINCLSCEASIVNRRLYFSIFASCKTWKTKT